MLSNGGEAHQHLFAPVIYQQAAQPIQRKKTMTNKTTYEAEVRLPTLTADGYRAFLLHEAFWRDVLNTFDPEGSDEQGSFVSYDGTSVNRTGRGKLEIQGVKIYRIRHSEKADDKLRSLVTEHMANFNIRQLIYVNFSNKFEDIDLDASDEEKVEEITIVKEPNKKSVKNVKLTNKK